jgi:hypothetical protein
MISQNLAAPRGDPAGRLFGSASPAPCEAVFSQPGVLRAPQRARPPGGREARWRPLCFCTPGQTPPQVGIKGVQARKRAGTLPAVVTQGMVLAPGGMSRAEEMR